MHKYVFLTRLLYDDLLGNNIFAYSYHVCFYIHKNEINLNISDPNILLYFFYL